jgi:hypothetical protein
MNLHELFLFLLNFNEQIPQTFLLWLERYPKLEQDSLLCIILNGTNYKFKSKIRNKVFEHNLQHKADCRCKQYYNALSDIIKFPFSIVGKCLESRTYDTKENVVTDLIVYSNIILDPLSLQAVPSTTTIKLGRKRFVKFPNYEKKNNTFTIYALLTLLKKEDFDFYKLTSYLDVIEVGIIYVLIQGVFTERFIDKFLPNYCRTLRYTNAKNEPNYIDTLTEIYQKFYNVKLRKEFPSSLNYVSISLRQIKTHPQMQTDFETIQLGYVGERFVMHATTQKMHIMNDFGEYLGVYSQYVEYPFDDNADYVLECVKTRLCCYVVDVYMCNRKLLYNETPRVRADILSSIFLKESSQDFKISPLINPSEMLKYLDLSEHVLTHGYNRLIYDSLIFRNNYSNQIIKYIIPKPRLVFDQSGAIRTEYIPGNNFEYRSKYAAYFLIKRFDKDIWSINAWNHYNFVEVGRTNLPMSFFENQKKNNMVKVYWDSIKNERLHEIVGIVLKKYKSIFNCISLEDLVKIK